MAKNWLMELTKLAKTDAEAKDLLAQLKSATTEEEKEKAKQNGKAYIQGKENAQEEQVQTSEVTETPAQEMDLVAEDKDVVCEHPVEPVVIPEKKVVDKKYDMSELAFNPRLAKMGITREEELFQMHVFVRKLTRDDKLAIRRSIYQKKKQYRETVQTKFRQQRAEKLAKLNADPEYQKYLHQQKFVLRITEALKAHCNVDWMLKNIDGLTVDVIKELLQKPANVNAFKQEKAEFVKNFYKRFGK